MPSSAASRRLWNTCTSGSTTACGTPGATPRARAIYRHKCRACSIKLCICLNERMNKKGPKSIFWAGWCMANLGRGVRIRDDVHRKGVAAYGENVVSKKWKPGAIGKQNHSELHRPRAHNILSSRVHACVFEFNIHIIMELSTCKHH